MAMKMTLTGKWPNGKWPWYEILKKFKGKWPKNKIGKWPSYELSNFFRGKFKKYFISAILKVKQN